ncbi:hypothetical protein L249_1287 [Ophiocordyceps polyrhachis-furcata BCC 54312]|uniref:Protein arginine methyltransferase NDUFAF7 n=1 Tax=Ophiocordyceps polyrhachis-furcata BCC 54312 TaxID=1330021 RepID=A0A367LFC5_9HYPO|nr:hypothetical protein L249_1287 [Ophiocordyceps polyrhachis-furcata BCC 54312]
MESPPPLASKLFKHLFQRRSPACLRRHYGSMAKSASSIRDRGMKTNESRWQQRTNVLPEDRSEEFLKYPYLTARDLRRRTERPRRAKMLLRDFIEDSLYNPSYGYFSKQAVIFTPGEPFDFLNLRDELSFQAELGRRYTSFEDDLDAKAGRAVETRQLWHTPTELFADVYVEAIARYLVANYRLTTYPYDDLVIFEMGAGRGTLMLNMLDFIRQVDPDVYARTRFTVIEISPSLAAIQAKRLTETAAASGHAERVEIVPVSIFDWDRYVPKPCFFLALEVMDNLAHDCIRYDVSSGEEEEEEEDEEQGRGQSRPSPQPLQGHVLVDSLGDLYEFYARPLDPIASRFFSVREAATGGFYPRPYHPNPLLRAVLNRLPFAANLSRPEFIPTRLMQLFEVLDRYFPAHRLLASDFDELPQAIDGLNAPVVQTRYRRRMVPVTTPLVHQGYFDILFPTDFSVAEALYRAITGKLSRVSSHCDFMTRWADVDRTRTRSGESPLLSHYRNASVLLTV